MVALTTTSAKDHRLALHNNNANSKGIVQHDHESNGYGPQPMGLSAENERRACPLPAHVFRRARRGGELERSGRDAFLLVRNVDPSARECRKHYFQLRDIHAAIDAATLARAAIDAAAATVAAIAAIAAIDATSTAIATIATPRLRQLRRLRRLRPHLPTTQLWWPRVRRGRVARLANRPR